MNRPDAEDIVQALRSGLVPRRGLHHLATGMDALMGAVNQELDFVADLVQPSVHDALKRSRSICRRLQPLDEPAIHRF